MKTKKIKDLISKPSEALEVMVQGLLNQDKREDFKVNMGTFWDDNIPQFGDAPKVIICFGCAATCFLQEIAKVNLTYDPAYPKSGIYRHTSMGLDPREADSFEDAIDMARGGELRDLFDLFGVLDKWRRVFDNRFCLTTPTWKNDLPLVNSLIDDLKSEGL